MADKVKIPKKVGGVKIPKKVRKRVKKALNAGRSPAADLAAAALNAAAARAAAQGLRGAAFRARCRPRAVRVEMDPEIDAMREKIRAAALNGLRRFLEGFEEGLARAEAAAKPEAPSGPAPGSA